MTLSMIVTALATLSIIQLAGVVASPVPVEIHQLETSSSENSPVHSPRHHQKVRHKTLPLHQHGQGHPILGSQAIESHQSKVKGLNPHAEPFIPSSIGQVTEEVDQPVSPHHIFAADPTVVASTHKFLSEEKDKYLKSIGVDPETAVKERVYALPKQMYHRHRSSSSSSSSSRSSSTSPEGLYHSSREHRAERWDKKQGAGVKHHGAASAGHSVKQDQGRDPQEHDIRSDTKNERASPALQSPIDIQNPVSTAHTGISSSLSGGEEHHVVKPLHQPAHASHSLGEHRIHTEAHLHLSDQQRHSLHRSYLSAVNAQTKASNGVKVASPEDLQTAKDGETKESRVAVAKHAQELSDPAPASREKVVKADDIFYYDRAKKGPLKGLEWRKMQRSQPDHTSDASSSLSSKVVQGKTAHDDVKHKHEEDTTSPGKQALSTEWPPLNQSKQSSGYEHTTNSLQTRRQPLVKSYKQLLQSSHQDKQHLRHVETGAASKSPATSSPSPKQASSFNTHHAVADRPSVQITRSTPKSHSFGAAASPSPPGSSTVSESGKESAAASSIQETPSSLSTSSLRKGMKSKKKGKGKAVTATPAAKKHEDEDIDKILNELNEKQKDHHATKEETPMSSEDVARETRKEDSDGMHKKWLKMKMVSTLKQKNPDKYQHIKDPLESYHQEGGVGKLASDLYKENQIESMAKDMRTDKASARRQYEAVAAAVMPGVHYVSFVGQAPTHFADPTQSSPRGASPPRTPPKLSPSGSSKSLETGKGHKDEGAVLEDAADSPSTPNASDFQRKATKKKGKKKKSTADTPDPEMKRRGGEVIDNDDDILEEFRQKAEEERKGSMTPEAYLKRLQDFAEGETKRIRQDRMMGKLHDFRHMMNPEKYKANPKLSEKEEEAVRQSVATSVAVMKEIQHQAMTLRRAGEALRKGGTSKAAHIYRTGLDPQ